MRVDGLALELRPRSMAEAAELGMALVRQHAGAVWRCWLPVYGIVVLLAIASASFAGWAPEIVIFWLKPWLDRSVLFVLSRAVFGESTRWGDLWRHARAVWAGELLRTLTLARLSPWRAYTQPVGQLEGQRGGAARTRRRLLLRGRRGTATLLQTVFGNVELVLYLSLITVSQWLVPNESESWLQAMLVLFFTDGLGITLALYVATVALLEPFYVGAGFGMYLNRRVELEAWDVEQELRLAFPR